MIYPDFERNLLAEGDGKQNSEESYKNKYQKRIACCYGHKLVRADDNFSRSL